MKNYKYLLILVILVVGANLLHAQDSDQEWKKTDSLAIQFSVDDILNVDVSSFQAGGLSFKKLLPGDRSFRVGLRLTGNHRITYEDHDSFQPDIDSTYGEENFRDGNWNLHIQSQFLQEHIVSEDNRIILYYGLGPAFSAGFNTNGSTDINTEPEYQDSYSNPWKQKRRYEQQKWTLGAGLSTAIGIEWFIKNQFSLMLEYAPDLMVDYENRSGERVTKRKNNIDSEWEKDSEQEITSHNWNISIHSSNTRFGISLYF